MSDVDYRNASIATGIPVDTLKQFFKENEVRLIPAVMKGDHQGEEGYFIRAGLMLFDIVFNKKCVGWLPLGNLIRPTNHWAPKVYSVKAEVHHKLCETFKIPKVWEEHDSLLENKKAFWNTLRAHYENRPGKTVTNPTQKPLEIKIETGVGSVVGSVTSPSSNGSIEETRLLDKGCDTANGLEQNAEVDGEYFTIKMPFVEKETKNEGLKPRISLESGDVDGSIQEASDCFLHQKGWKFRDVLQSLCPSEINFYAPRVSLGGLYNLSKIYSETTHLHLYLMRDEKQVLFVSKSDLEIKHQLEQGKKAYKCRQWIAEDTKRVSQISSSERTFNNTPSPSVTFKQNGKGGYLLGNQELTRDFLEDGIAYAPFETILLSYNESACNALQKQMGEIPWVDVQKSLIDKELYEYTKWRKPEFIYYLTLWHLYQKRVNAFFEDDGDLKNTSVWEKLFDFQRDGAIAILEKLETYGGCILADSVGLGKTFTALAVIMAYQRMGKNVAVFCPKRLMGNWERFKSTLDTNPFRDAHNKSVFNFKLFSHTDLKDRAWQKRDGHNLNFSLIVIDESHNFRNDSGARYQFLQELLTKSKNTKVLMLTATPINNRVRDLKNQLKLLWHVPYGANQGELYAKFTRQVVDVIDKADDKIKWWQERYHEQNGNVKPLRYYLPEEYFGLLKRYVVARSVAIVRQDYAQFFQQGRSLPIEVCKEATPGIANNISISEIVDIFERLTFVAYDLRGYFEGQRAVSHLLGMLKIGFLKRFESSVESARKTLDSLIKFMEKTRERVGRYNVGYNNGTAIEEDVIADHVDATDDNIELTDNKGISVRVKSREQIFDFSEKIKKDCQQLREVLNKLKKISPNDDLKLQDLKERIRAKMKMPVQKILIFTAYKDTAEYLYENIRDMGYRVACVSGGGVKANQWGFSRQDDVLKSFAPEGQEVASSLNPLQILIATDCISEGQNLQDCDMVINYDIHWNPVRLTQRNGRINRIGSRHQKVTVVNYWPMSDVDEYLKIYTRVMTRTAIGGTVTDGRGLGAEMEAVKREAFFQNQRLKEMQMSVGNRPLEQAQAIKLYDTRAFVADFHAQQEKQAQRELFKEIARAPLGLYAISTKPLPDSIVASVIFLLRKKRLDSTINHSENYKLVMVDKLKGCNEYRCELSDSKILQRYQNLCRGNTEIDQAKEKELAKLNSVKLESLLGNVIKKEDGSSNLDEYTLATYLLAGDVASFMQEVSFNTEGAKQEHLSISESQRKKFQLDLEGEMDLFNKRVKCKLEKKFNADDDGFEGSMAEFNQVKNGLELVMHEHAELMLDVMSRLDLFSKDELNEYQGIVMDFHKLLHRWELIFNEKKVGSSEEVDDIVKSLENVKMRINNFLSDVTEW